MFYIHAPNVHQGGGYSLLSSLIDSVKRPVVLHLDKRFHPVPPLPEGSRVTHVTPSLHGRFQVERRLRDITNAEDTVLCFGNLPPLFRQRARVFVYLQNIYLLDASRIGDLPLKVRVRLRLERFWLRRSLRNAEIIVQTQTMADLVQATLKRSAHVMPFHTPLERATSDAAPEYDFLFVASGEAHKNHLRLFQAWKKLAAIGIMPKLAITFEPYPAGEVGRALERARSCGAKIYYVGSWKKHEMPELYAKARFLIYPSLFESFGLPLLEAAQAGLPIIAAERDYVRDVVDPLTTFDPLSSRSIARAVRRALGQGAVPRPPATAEDFLDRLSEIP